MLSYKRSLPLWKTITRLIHSSSRCCSKPFKKKWMFSSRHGSHSNELALQYFDFAYPLVFHRHWPSIRLGLLSLPKPVALINSFSTEKTDVMNRLISEGAVDLLRFDNEKLKEEHLKIQENISKSDQDFATMKLLEQHERRLLLGNTDVEDEIKQEHTDDLEDDDDDDDGTLVEDEESLNTFKQPDPVQNLKDLLKQSLEKQVHTVVKGNVVPVVDEDSSKDYKKIPPSWNVYTFPRANVSRFQPAKVDDIGLLNYYCMDGACILPVLALDVQPFHSVLDMCSAPGGKALNIFLQCPYINLTCNDNDTSRWKRLSDVFSQIVPKTTLSKHVNFIRGDACLFGKQKAKSFDRVLVDVPCTSDRHSLITAFNIFSKKRIGERAELPVYQQKLLESAIRACKPGGIVVYSTCTLAPAQNEGVVESAIENLSGKSMTKSNQKRFVSNDEPIQCEIVSTRLIEEQFAYFFDFYKKMSYGSLVLPHISNNFGPMYFCKIRRIS